MQHFVYTGWDRKEVEVEVNGRWYDGELRSWDQADDGTWSASSPGGVRSGRP